MPFKATPFANLPTTDDAWDPNGVGKTALLSEVLGDDNWDRYKKAHLIYDPDVEETKAAYKLPIARMVGGELKAVPAQVSAAIAAINGARTPLAVPDTVRRAAYDNAVRYLEKSGVEEDDLPAFRLSLERVIAGGPRIALEELGTDDETKPIWQHVATAGEYRGYGYGEQPFSFTRETFEEMIKNFRADPAYKAGADGVGTEPVIPWDFHHATDADPADVAISGVPAQGWVLELGLKTGSDGNGQLWALTEWMPTAREYIRNGQYRWASISCWINAVDPKSGDRIGALLTSIAITNTPFIQGMEKLAASQQAAAFKVAARRGWYFDAAQSAMDAVGMMKDLFGLRETDSVAEVVAEISKIAQWVEMGSTPLGVNLDEIIGNLRTILNLRTLANASQVLSEASRITGALLTEQAPVPQPGTEAPETASMNEGTEDDMDLLKTLAEKLGVREVDSEVVAAAKDLVQLRATLKDKTGASKDTNRVLLAEVADAMDAKVNLKALYESLKAAKQSEAVDAVMALLDKSQKWDDAEAELTELRDKIAAEETVKAEADVDAAIKAHKLPEQVRPALLLERKQDPDGFAKRFPPLGDKQVLTQPLVTGKDAQVPEQALDNQGDVIDLSMYAGNNPTHRLKLWIRGNIPGADKWDEEQVNRQAFMLRRIRKVVGIE
jgi:hypothetical protein